MAIGTPYFLSFVMKHFEMNELGDKPSHPLLNEKSKCCIQIRRGKFGLHAWMKLLNMFYNYLPKRYYYYYTFIYF